MRLFAIVLIISYLPQYLTAQTPYTSFFTGDTSDVTPPTLGGICMMGGSTEDDNAMRWFLQRANGGDVVVIRASGSNGYNNYLFSELGIKVNSVESIVMPTEAAALEPYVVRQIRNAEALWIAGGDQWKYVSFWKNKPVGEALRFLIHEKKAVIGGTSAGMAILGDAYFDAKNGTVTSAQALANPFDNRVSIGYDDFLDIPILKNTITDTHYDFHNRRGRHLTFLARLTQSHQQRFFGIACEESTAVCIDTNGIAAVFGRPNQPDFAYFLQVNCVEPITPERCEAGAPLDWQRQQHAVKVYVVKGWDTWKNTFDLNHWKNGIGGTWENWWVENGTVRTNADATPPDCQTSGYFEVPSGAPFQLYPNPAGQWIQVHMFDVSFREPLTYQIFDALGRCIQSGNLESGQPTVSVSVSTAGVYMFVIESIGAKKFIIQP